VIHLKRITYFISHGHTARGAFQTGLLKKLSTAGFDVTVIAEKDPTGELHTKVKSQGAKLVLYSPPKGRLAAQIEIFRRHVHQDIRNNPSLWEKHQRLINDAKMSRRRRFANRAYYHLGKCFRMIPWLKNRYKDWEEKKFEDPKAVALLKELSPDTVISTRPVQPMEIYLLKAASDLKINRTFYLLSWDNITSKGIFPVIADSYLTWGPIMAQELKEYYDVPEKSIKHMGVTHFDVHADVKACDIGPKEVLTGLGLQAKSPYIFFTMSASYFAPNEIDIVEHLAKSVHENCFGESMQLVIRPHMANLMADRSDQSWLSRLETLDSSRVKVDFPKSDNSLLTWYMAQDDMLHLSTLLNNAAVCLNSGSTIAIEAIYLDRPVVITAFDTETHPIWESARRLREYIHLKKLFAMNACRVVDDLKSMDTAIIDYLNDPQLDSQERQNAVEQECFKNDGRATERFVQNIQQIVNTHG
jgi:hypothetical protein